MELGTSSAQLIATAFTFGLASMAFAYLPFLFILVNGILKANSGHNAHSSSIMNVFAVAFLVHLVSCILFMLGVKLLDILGALYEENYLQNKIFSIFWARGQSSVFSLSGAGSSIADEGIYLQLYVVQTINDWLMIGGIWAVIIAAFSYAMIQTKRDTMQFNYTSFAVWLILANIAGYFIYFLWAKIASLAMFIPNGEDLISKIYEIYANIVGAI